MFVCICNALTDRDLAAAARDAARAGCSGAVAAVFRRCGRRPQCGKCLSDVAAIIEDQSTRGPASLLAAE